jgi:hypothetical protein
MFIPLTANAVGALPAVPTNWQLNGSATANASTGTIQLTPASTEVAGSAFSALPVATAGLAAAFTAQLNGGTGADGLTFALADTTQAGPTALGAPGGGLGFSGISGIAVALNTFPNTQANSNNFVGIMAGPNSGNDVVTYLATATVPTPLRTGTHTVAVSINGGVISVFVDGTKLLAYTPAAGVIPANAYAGFTGGTGGQTDIHAVSNVNIVTQPAAAVLAPLTAAPASVTSPAAPNGTHVAGTLTLTNSGTATEVVMGVTAPSGRFAVDTLPAPGVTLLPGASLSLHVYAVLGGTAPLTGSFAVSVTGGTVTVQLITHAPPPTGIRKPGIGGVGTRGSG